MIRRALHTAILAVTFMLMLPAQASYEAGQRAWEAGRTDEALAQWQAAAGSEDRRAMHALGRAYLQGLGVLQDYVEAHKWFNLAASRGAAEAVAERDALADKMTPAHVARAQELAREWRPSESRGSAASEETTTAPAPPAAVLVEETLTPTRDSLSTAVADEAAPDSPETAEAVTVVLAEETLTPTRDSPSAAVEAITAESLKPKCTAVAENVECWMEVANTPECHVWAGYEMKSGNNTVTWSGECAGGVAIGKGTETWQGDGFTFELKGTYSNGKKHGHWMQRGKGYSVGIDAEGSWVDGKKHGHWVMRSPGRIEDAYFADGKAHGRWVNRLPHAGMGGRCLVRTWDQDELIDSEWSTCD